MDTIVNGKAPKSQASDIDSSSEANSDKEKLVNRIMAILYSRDKIDLLIIEYIILSNTIGRGIDVKDVMSYLRMSNPSLSVRLRRLREKEAGGIEIPLLRGIKNTYSFIYYFTELIPLDKGLLLVQDIMAKKGISYERYCLEKGIVAEQDSAKNAEENSSNQNYSEEDAGTGEDSESENKDHFSSEVPPEVNFDELSSMVTMREVLEMIDEASENISQNISQNIIETVTETFVQILDEKVDEINTRVTELEQKFSQINIPKVNRESKEELVQRVRLLVRQKLSFKNPDKS
ncbi:MAG: hypothetical protein KME50_07115 [Nostoc desertorum CM1-VF14]|nr:hypothetical protein [Nostoc desertorum CM1-VF14]